MTSTLGSTSSAGKDPSADAISSAHTPSSAGMTSSAVHDYDLVIKEHHLDTFGHVNNATYLELLEEARWDYITSNGYGLETVRRLGLGPVILEVTLKFKHELGNRQKIRIRSGIERYERKIGSMYQNVYDEEGRLCCEARFVFGLFDLNERKLVEPTPEWLRALGLSP
jgi:acyl-CoA thioester hydrolase